MAIVVGMDLSSEAERAADAAGAIAERTGDRLLLVHAFSTPAELSAFSASGRVFLDPAPHTASEGRPTVGDELETIRLRLHARCPVEALVREGSPHAVLLGVVKERRATLLAVGMHESAGSRRLRGTPVEKLVSDAPVPVLAVRLDANPFEKWRHAEGLQVLTALELPSDPGLLDLTVELKSIGPCEIHFLSVSRPTAPAFDRLGAASTEPVREREFASRIAEARRIDAESTHVHVEFGSNVTDKILEVCRALPADLLVVGHRAGRLKSAIVGSTAFDALRYAPCPVLVLPEGATPRLRSADVLERRPSP